MHGKVCLVTGANSGIGKATAMALAQRHAEVWLLCRNPERGNIARNDIIRETGNCNIHLAIVDMSDCSDIHTFAESIAPSRVDVLVHNAGVMPHEKNVTEDGNELTLATNLLGPFLLTEKLIPHLERSADGRVILVSSGGMYTQKLDLERMENPPEPFDGVVQYAQTKRAMVILGELWAERYQNKRITFASMHPGWVDTPALQKSMPRFQRLTQSVLRNADEGADTVIWLAVRDETIGRNGAFWFDRMEQSTYPLPWTREPSHIRQNLYSWCEQRTHIPTRESQDA